MKKSISVLLILFFFQSCIKKSTQKKESTIANNELIKKVETGLTTRVHINGDATWAIEERMKHYGIPGVSIAVIHDGKIAWAKGYGIINKESKTPVTKNTLFQAAATSMPVSAYGALHLVEQDKVDLDENINNYLKSWKVPENEFTKKKKVTLRNLLNHSAGIYPRGTGRYNRDETIPSLVEILNGAYPAKNEPITTNKVPEESVRFAYASYVPVQQLMLEIEKKPFPEIMNEFVLQPLEMNSSTYNQTLTTAQQSIAATGYLKDGSMVEGRSKIYPAMASHGLWTTAEDYAKFIANVQQTLKGNPTKALSKKLTKLMGTPYGVSDSDWSFTLGLGFQLLNRSNDIYLRHHGWNEGFYAEIMAHRDKGYGVVVLTNSTFPEFNAEVIRSVALAYNWDNFVPKYQKKAITPSGVTQLTGRYQFNNTILEVFQKDNQLYLKNILKTTPNELIKISDSLFVKRNSPLHIQFKTDAKSGKMQMLQLWNNGTIYSTYVKVDHQKKEPVEYILEGNYKKALSVYMNLKKQDANHPAVTEAYIDDLGYDFYHEGRMELSLNTFKININLYPDSFKVYESYAEACLKARKNDLAMINYAKSLELNPQNNKAKARLKELQKNK
ncbi:TPR_REGION domain-containing protein [Tenacibaculum sp. 190130A14a]|uniref:TPR_REGION domain-containing protein n=1 Tax=Tenacibaculum polynesiense TaxID=3137857 RepID=A0ABP1F0N0_9FLAO